jgi:hypothetical protein
MARNSKTLRNTVRSVVRSASIRRVALSHELTTKVVENASAAQVGATLCSLETLLERSDVGRLPAQRIDSPSVKCGQPSFDEADRVLDQRRPRVDQSTRLR